MLRCSSAQRAGSSTTEHYPSAEDLRRIREHPGFRVVVGIRDVACFQIKAMFINTTRKIQDTRSFNKIKDCLIGPLKLVLDGEKL